MKTVLVGSIVVVGVLAGVLAHAVEPLVLYDDFNAEQLDAGKWVREEDGAGNYQGWRYSSLQQINTTNVQRLAVKWTFRTGSGDENFQATPLVIDGVMYLTNQRNEIFALHAETGKVLWRYTYFQVEFSPQMPGWVWGQALRLRAA